MTTPTTTSGAPAADGRATKARETFRMQIAVAVNIRADASAIWRLLTDAAGFPRWNSTVTSIEGTIAAGQTLTLRVPLAPTRTFKPKVTTFEPPARMVWQEGNPIFRGARTFSLAARPDGTTDFAMTEVYSGAMFPLIVRSLPDFAPSFEKYAADLKRAAEQPAR
jgi:hypothetical protein